MNFGGIEEIYSSLKKSSIVLLPVPYDATSTWIKGADKGPEAILEASANMELYDIETRTEIYKKGIHTASPVLESKTPEKMTDAVREKVNTYLEMNKFVVTAGGNHSVSIGTVMAHAKKFKNLTVLQLDAHSDLRHEYEGSMYNHACVMARIKELVPVVQVGIRSMSSEETYFLDESQVIFAHDMPYKDSWEKKALKLLTKNVYITIDLDVFDPSIMPSTGTPEPGGMQYYDVIHFLKKVIQHHNVVGFDVVELCPNPENKAPDFLAAKLIYQLLSYRFSEPE